MTLFEEAGFNADTVFIADENNFLPNGTLFVLADDDGSFMPNFKAVDDASETRYEFIHTLKVATPFNSRGWTKDDELVETYAKWYPKGTILVLAKDDGTEIPLFKAKDETISGTFHISLDRLRRASDEVPATPFEEAGFTKDDLLEIKIEGGTFSVGTQVKLVTDDCTDMPLFACVVTGDEYYVNIRRLAKAEVSVYDRTIKSSKNADTITVDVYSVLAAFEVTNSAVAHAIKKLLAPGKRGVKNEEQDIREAIGSLERSLTM